MTYSVWDPAARTYLYYEDGVNDPRPPVAKHLPSRELGVASGNAGWPLPTSAKLVGKGPVAKGMIATRNQAGALGDVSLSQRNWLIIGGFGLAAWGLWKVMVK